MFYDRTYEKYVNKLILDDKNYVVPRQQLSNYVRELLDIPYVDFIEYIKRNHSKKKIDVSDITQFSSFSSCETEMCKALLWANNPGCQYIEIGRLFPEKVSSQNEVAYRKYGENHIKASSQLGLTFVYYDYWYLSCLGYIYPDLSSNDKNRLLARTIIRNGLYQQMIIDILEHDIAPATYMNILSESTIKRRYNNVCRFLEICLAECSNQGIKTFRIRNKKKDNKIKLFNYDENFDPEQNRCDDEFLSEIGRYPMISAEEEVELFYEYQRHGDQDAFNRIISSKLRFVASIARNFEGQGLSFKELFQEGTIGLIKAAKRFDETRGIRFIEYAFWWIRRSIIQALLTLPYFVQIPLNQLSIYRKIRKEIDQYEQENGFEPSINEIEIDDTVDQKNLKYLSSLPCDLLKMTHYSDDWDSEPSNISTDDTLMMESRSCFVNSLLNMLPPQASFVLRRKYGIGEKIATLSEIGDELYLTRERVRQIAEKAVRRLRELLTKYNRLKNDDIFEQKESKVDSTIKTITKEVDESLTVNNFKKDIDSINRSKTEHIRSEDRTNVGCDVKEDVQASNDFNLDYNKIDELVSPRITLPNVAIADCKNSHDNSDKVKIKVEGNRSLIFDSSGRVIYSTTGRIIVKDDILYRLEYTYSSFSVNLINLTVDGTYQIGNRIIRSNHLSALYKCLIEKGLCNQIEEIEHENDVWHIKVNGEWFDEKGNLLGSNDEVYRPSLQVQPHKSFFVRSDTHNNKNIHDKKESVSVELEVGDVILYESKKCVVLEKRIIDDSLRLIIQYENDTIDNVIDDDSKYTIINHQDAIGVQLFDPTPLLHKYGYNDENYVFCLKDNDKIYETYIQDDAFFIISELIIDKSNSCIHRKRIGKIRMKSWMFWQLEREKMDHLKSITHYGANFTVFHYLVLDKNTNLPKNKYFDFKGKEIDDPIVVKDKYDKATRESKISDILDVPVSKAVFQIEYDNDEGQITVIRTLNGVSKSIATFSYKSDFGRRINKTQVIYWSDMISFTVRFDKNDKTCLYKYNLNGKLIKKGSIAVCSNVKETLLSEDDISKLWHIFDNKVTSYKYFWFLSILQLFREGGQMSISYKQILARMISNAWEFVFSEGAEFPKADQIPDIVNKVMTRYMLEPSSDYKKIEGQILYYYDRSHSERFPSILLKNVPYRFLSPWIPFTNNDDVVAKSNEKDARCPYSLHVDHIKLNPLWCDYLIENYDKIEAFIGNELSLYLKC